VRRIKSQDNIIYCNDNELSESKSTGLLTIISHNLSRKFLLIIY